MGIKNLNRFISTQCTNEAIVKTHLSEFAGKRIAVDASIYMYRFMSENRFIEQFYLLISLFRHYNIIPLFVFDGKAPEEKKELIKERREKKQCAEQQYANLANKLESSEITDEERNRTEAEMTKLKKQFVRIRDSDITTIQTLLTASGISWVEAHGEADILCAQLMYRRRVYACMSEDMDMFVYGCSRVLRHLSLINHTVLLYDLQEILTQLKMNLMEFKDVLILSGTDYNKNDETELNESIRWFHKYKKTTMLSMDGIPTFYEWLNTNTKYIKDYEQLIKSHRLFNIQYELDTKFVDNIEIANTDPIEEVVMNILKEDGFIFPTAF